MIFVRLLPVVLSMLLLGAHFLRGGWTWLAAACVAAPLLLLVRARWIARLLQVVLVLGAAEWVRTLVAFVSARIDGGQDWTRLAVILGSVAIFTLASAAVFEGRALRRRYRLGGRAG